MTNTTNTDDQIEKYEKALSLLFYEGQIAWQMNLLFIGLNVDIGSIIQNKLSNFRPMDTLLIIMSIVGVIINVLWLGTFNRNNRHYHFRMAQARNCEPDDWSLVKDSGFDFSQGKSMSFASGKKGSAMEEHKLTSFEKFASNKLAIWVSIWVFIISFGLLFIYLLDLGFVVA